jgi:hypothetical protein
MVEHFDADPNAKRRLQVLLQTISGEISVPDACNQLNISQARFFELRATMLEAALHSLEPKPAGRPVHPIDPASQHIEQLEQQILDLRVHLHAAQLREEIALAMPHLAKRQRSKSKKKSASNQKTRPASSFQITQPNDPTAGKSTPGSIDT